MFGTPYHLYNCGKIDHRCPFWWISEPAPLLFEPVGQQEAISYAARADKNFHNVDGASFFHLASPHIDETSSFYFLWFGGSMAALWSERRFRGSLSDARDCLVSLVRRTKQTRKTRWTRSPPRAAKFRMSQIFLQLTLILLLVQNFTNSLQAGKMGAYLHASTYVSPTLLHTFLFPRRGP